MEFSVHQHRRPEQDTMSSSNQPLAPASYPSWILVEVEEVASQRNFFVIHATQVVGTFNPNVRKIRFFRENRQYPGIVLVVSDHRRYVEQECKRLLELEKTAKSGVLWGLVRVAEEANKVRLTTINCERLRCCEDASKDRRSYLLELGGHLVPVALLHILPSERSLRDVMAYIKELVFRNIGCKKKADGIFNMDQAYLLIQYYEDSSNLVFTIVSYSDTVWKDRNRFPMVVAYIALGERSCQSIILRMSYDLNELAGLLEEIRNACDSQDYRVLHEQLRGSEIKEASFYSRLALS